MSLELPRTALPKVWRQLLEVEGKKNETNTLRAKSQEQSPHHTVYLDPGALEAGITTPHPPFLLLKMSEGSFYNLQQHKDSDHGSQDPSGIPDVDPLVRYQQTK